MNDNAKIPHIKSVETRHLALPIEAYYDLKSWGKANNHWIEVAQELGQKALCCALTRAGFAPSDLGALFFVQINLLVNARHAMNGNGDHAGRVLPADVERVLPDAPPVSLTTTASADRVRITVADRGPGIGAADRDDLVRVAHLA